MHVPRGIAAIGVVEYVVGGVDIHTVGGAGFQEREVGARGCFTVCCAQDVGTRCWDPEVVDQQCSRCVGRKAGRVGKET
jgi:hypothetical protein